MNKKKGIIIGAFALVITMVVGYALFGKNIEIKGTATASGNFELSYTCKIDESSEPGTCEIVDNTITTTNTFTKPNENAIYHITIKNSGTIPAELKTITSPNNYDLNRISSGELIAGDSFYIDKTTMLYAYYVFEDYGEGLGGDSAVEAAKITLQPNETTTIGVVLGWVDSDLFGMSQPELKDGRATMNYNITLGFSQAE